MATKIRQSNNPRPKRQANAVKAGEVQSAARPSPKRSSGAHVPPQQTPQGRFIYYRTTHGNRRIDASAPSNAELVKVVKDGLLFSDFEQLRADMDVSTEALAATVNIPIRTLARRKQEGKFHQDESERLLRVRLVFEKAKDVLEGTENARRWFTSPKKALGGKTPLEYADTEPGAREVEHFLGRIEHGVFS